MAKKSLNFRLMLILSATSCLIWLIATGVAWLQTKKEVNDVFDAQQILFAERLASSDLEHLLLNRSTDSHYGGFKPYKRHYDDDALAFAVFTKEGKRVLSDGDNGDRFIFEAKIGFSQNQIEGDDDDWRLFWQPVGSGNLIVVVGQELEYREELVNQMIFGQMWIWFTGLPLLLGILAWFIRRELMPLKHLSRELQQRRPDDVSLLKTTRIPTEILPLVQNLNQFLGRTSAMLQRERRFISDAAHELRSPLAALRIQTEVAQLAGDDEKIRAQALLNLTQGIDRATQLIEQLLMLSRLDNLQELEGVAPINWQATISSLIGELYFNAQKYDIELIFEEKGIPPHLNGQPLLIYQMLRNLIDNAIKYAKSGAYVKIILTKDHIVIEDNGGGVSETDLMQLGQRFYRPAGQNEKGSGLGLSIVFRIAELHRFKVRLENVTASGKVIGFKVVISLNSFDAK